MYGTTYIGGELGVEGLSTLSLLPEILAGVSKYGIYLAWK